jgi:hypothetical protein
MDIQAFENPSSGKIDGEGRKSMAKSDDPSSPQAIDTMKQQ